MTPSYDNRNGNRKEMPPGAPKPAMSIIWDAEKQLAFPIADQEQIKSIDMAVGILQMSLTTLQFQQRMLQMQQVQQAEAQQMAGMMQAQQEAQRIKNLVK